MSLTRIEISNIINSALIDLFGDASIESFTKASEESWGVCLNCGYIHFEGCEPDAENYTCESCLKNSVIGLENFFLESF